MKAETRVTSKGQVVIPKPIRDRLRWYAGTRLRVETEPDGAVRLAVLSDDAGNESDPIELVSGFLGSSGGEMLAALERDHQREVGEDERGRRRRR